MAENAKDLAALRASLVARLEDLRSASEHTSDERKPVELDQTAVGRLSRIDALQVQAMAQAAEQNRRDEARRTEAAIARIDDGDYGWCIACGEEIAPKRLAVDPIVPTCIGCASKSSR